MIKEMNMTYKNFVLAMAWFGRPRISLIQALTFPASGSLTASGWYFTAFLTLFFGMLVNLVCEAADETKIAKEARVTKV